MVYQSKRESITIRSSIKAELLHLAIKRGGLVGASGGLLIILSGTFIPIDQLKIWGIPLFLTGLALIGVGFLPYRKLNRLQLKPHKLQYDGETFLFFKEGKALFKIPEKSIERMEYREKETLYGLAIWLKRPIRDKVHVLQPRFDIEAFVKDSADRFDQCDLFLPYFSKRACQELESILTPHEE